MSLELSNLSVLAYANNFTLWHFKTEDSSVETPGYFNTASEMMDVNDLIIANVDIDAGANGQFYIVTDVTSGVVTVTALA